jgi:hypothetical protein
MDYSLLSRSPVARFLLIALALLVPRLSLAGGLDAPDWQYWPQCSADPAEFAAEYVDHPVIKPYGTPTPRPARPALEVETYYTVSNFFTDVLPKKQMKEWNEIAPGTKPKYKVDRLAQVVVYLPERNDEQGVAMLREEVAKLGADAMVDVVRMVCVNPRPTGTGYSLWVGRSFKFPVVGWGYYGVAVVQHAEPAVQQ